MPLSVELPLEQHKHLFTQMPTTTVLSFGAEPPMFLDYGHSCQFCGVRPRPRIEDEVVHLSATECPAPDGLTTVVTLNVPSGKIVVADSLGDVYSVDDADLASYNTALGQAQYVYAMAAQGCAYGPVGNSCPGLYRTGPDTFVIGNPAYDTDTYEPFPFHGEHLAGITTDLWAYSIADFEDWRSRGGDPTTSGWTRTVVDVEPGVYRFTHHTGERTFNHDATGVVVFADIERIS